MKNVSSIFAPNISWSGVVPFIISMWRNTAAIFWKETKTYFTSPMAYIIAGVFLAITGYLFVQSISTTFPEASIRGWLEPSTTIFVLLSPALTMRLLAEEQKLGTLELLMTSPIRDYEIVLGKFFAVLAILLATLSLTMFYTLMLVWFGDPDIGPLLCGYLGIILFGASTLAGDIIFCRTQPSCADNDIRSFHPSFQGGDHPIDLVGHYSNSVEFNAQGRKPRCDV